MSQSITINEGGGINQYSYGNNLTTSKSKLSFHGIEIPSSLFPQPWEVKNNQVRLSWPFPFIIVLDICGNRDLDLNSSRTEIIMSEKWIDFEETLAYIICRKIKEALPCDYWQSLLRIFRGRTVNPQSIKALDKI